MKKDRLTFIINIIALIIGVLDVAFLIFSAVEFIKYSLIISFIPLIFYILTAIIIAINSLFFIIIIVYLFIKSKSK